MLDAVIELMPSRWMYRPSTVWMKRAACGASSSDEEPFSALAFKLMSDPYVGQLTFIRVYSGVLRKGDAVYNPVKGKKERIGRIVLMHANDRHEVDELRAGDIAACVGLKDVTTGDTLTDPNAIITLERMEFPDPVISLPSSQNQGRSGENGHCPATRRRKIRLSVCIPMKSPARRLSPVWVSYILRLSSIA